MDDVAISLDGRWFVQVDANGADQQLAELEIGADGIPTGQLLTCTDLTNDGATVVEDMEGSGFDHTGVLWGTTGNQTGTATDNRLWVIDPDTAIASHPSTGGTLGVLLDIASNPWEDYEGSDCRVPGVGTNTIEGTVFFDEDGDGLLGPGEEGWSDVTVRLYLDTNDDGVLDAGDELLQTAVTDCDGHYLFKVFSAGSYLVDIDTSTLPASTALTTDNLELAIFLGNGFRDPGNDFGFESTTQAFVTGFAVYDDGGVPVVELETASEVGTVGFYVERWDPSEARWVAVHEQLVPSARAAQGGRYRWRRRAGRRSRGATTGCSRWRRAAAVACTVRSWSSSRERVQAASRAESGRAERSIFYELTPAKLFVEERNLHWVSAEELARRIGLGPEEVAGMISAGALELLSGGYSWEVLAAPQGGIYFYGQPPESLFTRQNVYYVQPGWGRRMGTVNGRPWGEALRSSFRDRVSFEQEVFAATVISSDRRGGAGERGLHRWFRSGVRPGLAGPRRLAAVAPGAQRRGERRGLLERGDPGARRERPALAAPGRGRSD